jgi:AmmeMemoRadiSam system protein B
MRLHMRGFVALMALIMPLMGIASVGSTESDSVRPSALTGSWYPADRKALEKQLDAFLDKAPHNVEGKRIVAMISPHAGYVYSGEVAAWGYKNLLGVPFRRIVIMAPSHYVSFTGVSIPDVGYYETPLGRVRVDRDSCESLLKEPLFQSIREAHLREHAVEIQLPFLQRTLEDFELIPLVVGRLDTMHYESLTRQLVGLSGPDTLIIASSDFTHFGPRFGYVPFKEDLRKNISRLDHGAIDLILRRDLDGFLAYRENTQATICGFRPIGLLLKLLPASLQGRLLQYRLSGDLTGDYLNSVSYASIVFFRDGE